jgi:hypothetical protein
MITDPNGSYPGAQWNQTNGYAYYSQYGICTDCGRQLAGCGPVALAQYLRYYSKQPISKPTLNFSAMPPVINSSCNSMIYGEDQIALLIGYCGDMTDATYSSSPCETSTYDSDLEDGLSRAGCSSVGNKVDFYSNITNVRNELTGYHPIFIAGRKTGTSVFSGGHQWLIYGYTENHYYDLDCCQANGYGACVESGSVYYSLNWGWGPFGGNGWYTLHNFTGANGNYDAGLRVWLGTRP